MKKNTRFIALVLVIFSVSLMSVACSSSNNQETTVYITATGSAYHKTSGAHGYKTSSITLENAKAQGYTACKNGCY